MKRFFKWLPAAAFLAVSACASRPSTGTADRLPPPTIEANTPEAFRARFAVFEITPSDLRRFQRREIRKFSVSQDIGTTAATKLTLQLGERSGPAKALRTQSRYRVLDELGRVTVEAESTLALSDLSGEGAGIVVLTDSSAQAYFIAEEQSRATHRYLFLQAGRADYLKIPVPVRDLPAPIDPPRVLGLSGGRLFVKIMDRLYAFPVEALERQTDLASTIR